MVRSSGSFQFPKQAPPHPHFHPILFCCGVPAAGAEVHVPLEEIQGVVNGLLLDAEEPPLFDQGVPAAPRGLQQRGGLAVHKVLVGLQKPSLILHLCLEAAMPLLRRGATRRPAVGVHAEGGADLVDLLAHGRCCTSHPVVLEVDHKDGLVDFAPRLGVLHGLEDLLKVGEGVATCGSEQHSREPILLLLVDDAGDAAEHRLQRPSARNATLLIEKGPGSFILELVLLRAGGSQSGCLGDVRHGGDGCLYNVALLQGRVAPLLGAGLPGRGRPLLQLRVVLLELNELLVDFQELRLHLIQLVGIRVVHPSNKRGFGALRPSDALHLRDSKNLVTASLPVQEGVDVVLDNFGPWNSCQLLQKKTNDPLHLINALDILLVGPVHISDVHILELHLGILADQVYKFPGALHWHHQGPMLHRLRTKQA
eukprot:s6597_g5.t1